ncbi:hypothetical protein U9M48_018572 [Paspalum notatum var. saurae]|uniref:Helitron helicase-like domain-containing protein n=1 Tax=Paspalum notatum var. saurae TaxID=547442 RepID=A0AAQ3TAG6_PASNO
MTRVAQTNNMAGHGIIHDDWLHRNESYVGPSVDMSKISRDDTSGVFSTMTSAIFNSTIKNTPYNALKGGKNREWLFTRNWPWCDSTKCITQRASQPYARMTRAGLRGVQNVFDSGLWEPDDPMHRVEENDLDNQDLDDGDDDMYEDDEARASNQRDFQYKCYRQPGFQKATVDPFDFVYNKLLKGHLVLKKVPNCKFCNAKRFPREGPAFCCRKGKVVICRKTVPDELRKLFETQTDRDAKYFWKNIRYFDSHFSFTSFGVSLDRRLATAKGTGVYTFKAHGQIYHRLDQLAPCDKGPRYMQLYFYDTDDSIAYRTKRSPQLDADLIRKILGILQINPYVQSFKSLGTMGNLQEYAIALNMTISIDQRRFNAPAKEQVATIWMDGNDPEHMFDRSVVVYGKSDKPFYIRAYHGCYDPLGYPLFFPGGETGWEDKNILYSDAPIDNKERSKTRSKKQTNGLPLNVDDVDEGVIQHDQDPDDLRDSVDVIDREADGQEVGESRIYVSGREYYCYDLQIRLEEFNVLHYGGRLFQQWVVDMYVKVESMHLDWYSNP